jgi:predicted adenine nucleotide alpha hydrolase (AANH) superfamily ATPase
LSGGGNGGNGGAVKYGSGSKSKSCGSGSGNSNSSGNSGSYSYSSNSGNSGSGNSGSNGGNGGNSGKGKRLLLHVCCGPCAIWPVRDMAAAGEYAVSGLFYNPNIHPADEYGRRMEGAISLFAEEGLPLECAGGCDQRRWEAYVGAAAPERCGMCYRTRLEYVAEAARNGGFDAFSTTLLISPYQNHGLIRSICEQAALRQGVGFCYRDFRPHFREGQRMAKDAGLYRQKY